MDEGGCSGSGSDGPARVVPLVTLEAERHRRIDAASLEEIEAIFFASSNTQRFANPHERAAFRERWLGRYLDADRRHFLVALSPGGSVIGYLAGSHDDPAQQSRFADIGYFPALADLTRLYPAHLHINIDAGWRGRGIGGRLMDAFCARAAAAGTPGVHVVTGEGARNMSFYGRCGFHVLRSIDWNGARLVMLGRRLTPRAG